MVALGEAFFFSVERSHLWVVISNPTGERGEFVMVNLTTLDDEIFDESCVLNPIDYPKFITHKTAVYYIDARLWWMQGRKGYLELQQAGSISSMPPMSTRTLLSIQEGALKSEFFAPDYKKLVADSLCVKQEYSDSHSRGDNHPQLD